MLLIKHLKSLTNHNKMTKQGTYSPPFLLLPLHLHFIQVVPAIFQIANTSVRVQFIQQIEIHIRHQDHFRIRSRLSSFYRLSESKIARSEDT